MKKTMWTAALCSLLFMGACAAEEAGSPAPTPGDPSTAGLFSLEKDGQGPELVPAGDEGEPGEQADEGLSLKVNCSTIQWCNEPGPNGTICRWNACSYSKAYAECVKDANYVCGGITQPAYIR